MAVLAAIIAGLFSLTACGEDKSDRLSVVATIFPEYDWVKTVVGDENGVGITLLLDNGADLHSYQPTFKDIKTISECDLFIYVGGESDAWVSDALKKAKNKEMRVINLMETLGDKAKEEELVEGMQGEDEEDEGEEEGDEKEYDEHVWLSLKNAKIFVMEIARQLGDIDAENAEKYSQNAAQYCEKLTALDLKYAAVVEGGAKDTLLFADRFPFRYLVDDYGLKYYAAFVGCSAESEASPETIRFLADKTDELALGVILKIESSDGKIAETVKQTTASKNQNILVMDSLQSSTLKEYSAGRNYLSVMERNLEVLKEALK